VARITVSGVLSSWLASAVKRRSAPNDVSSRPIIAFSVAARRESSSGAPASPSPGANPPMASRRCSERPSVMASSSVTMRPSGRTARPAIHHAAAAESTSTTGAMAAAAASSSCWARRAERVGVATTTLRSGASSGRRTRRTASTCSERGSPRART
jgi:hypothetical protein